MIQEILTYIIVALAFAYTFYKLFHIIAESFKKSSGSVCGGCASCEFKSELKNISHPS